MMCQWGTYVGSDALCIEQLPFIIQSRQMTGQFTMHLTASFVVGIILAFPYVFWEFWRFFSPALEDNERSLSQGAVFFVSVLFMLGVLFGYYIVSPLSVNFLSNYQVDPSVVNEFDISSYVSTLTTLTLACAFMFQLPIVVYFLTKIGVATPAAMRAYRKISIVIILVISAIITPPDIMSQILITIPLLLLYEISIGISGSVLKTQAKKEAKELAKLEAREKQYEEQKALEEQQQKNLPLDQRMDDDEPY
jgi:sec-independent protein translocase protein TatC